MTLADFVWRQQTSAERMQAHESAAKYLQIHLDEREKQ